MNVVVTGGGTIAPIDDVRHIANVSTGRFSAMISEACLARGATVWHIHTQQAQQPLLRLAHFDLETTAPSAELDRLARLHAQWTSTRSRLRLIPLAAGTVGEYAMALEHVLRSEPIDVAFLAMAVSDFAPTPIPGKLESGSEQLILRCEPTPKVISSVRDWAPAIYLAGFKLTSGVETADLLRQAEAACATTRADLTIANDLQLVREGNHTVHLVRPGQPVETLEPGEDMADRLVDRVFAWSRLKRG